jgi:hypothetical protein
MRSVILFAGVLSVAGVGHAAAQCAPQMTTTQLQTVLANNTACVGTTPNATWSEWHNGTTTGSVVDWKLGPSDPVDPTEIVGTYAIASNGDGAAVTYTYGANNFSFTVTQGAGPVYTFCPAAGGGSILSVTIKTGQTSC